MCPNCILNETAGFAFLGPAAICLMFMLLGGYFLYSAKKSGEFEGDEEDAKYSVFDDE